MVEPISLGFSPCPNDTFMFHGLVHSLVPLEDMVLQPQLLDIEALNQRALQSSDLLDVSKLSLPTLARVGDAYEVLQAGAALGRGCGPLLVARPEFHDAPKLSGRRVAIPGEGTTAHLLLRSYGPADLQLEVMRFDQIMPAISAGKVDAGVIIHENRFTYEEHGLALLLDLGVAWEQDTGLPLPLGVIAARKELGTQRIQQIDAALQQSICLAMLRPELSKAYIRKHSQEIDEDVCRQHIALYVNKYSLGLGEQGQTAVAEMLRRA